MLDVAPTPLITAPPPIAGAIFLDASLAACDAQRGHAAPPFTSSRTRARARNNAPVVNATEPTA